MRDTILQVLDEWPFTYRTIRDLILTIKGYMATTSNRLKLGVCLRQLLWLLCTILWLLTSCVQEGLALQPNDIVKKMIQAYAALSSYQDSGTIESTMVSQGKEHESSTNFSLAFQRPNSLTLRWEGQKSDQVTHSYLTSDGTRTLTYFRDVNQYVVAPSLEMGIAGATGVSNGATRTVLPLLLGTSPLATLSDLQLVNNEELNGTPCYVISGKISSNHSYRLWIDREGLLLRQIEQSASMSNQMVDSIRGKLKDPQQRARMQNLSGYKMTSKVRHREVRVNHSIPDNILKPILPPNASVHTDLTKKLAEIVSSARSKGISPTVDPEEAVVLDFSSKDIRQGKATYEKHCIWCHGRHGAGDGPAAPYLTVKPRNFQQGIFKIKSTSDVQPPADGDLVLTVKHGLPGSTMPAYEDVLSDKEQRQVVGYITRRLVRSPRFNKDRQLSVGIDYGKRNVPTKKSLAKGKKLYVKGGCAKCHGAEGRGDGTLTLKDQWGFLSLPADLTKVWNFRGSRRDPDNPSHVYRAITAGLAGTPMPAYAERFSIEERWDLVNYVSSLSPKLSTSSHGKPRINFIIQSAKISKDLPSQPDAPAWEDAKVAYIPLTNNVLQNPRHFVNAVEDIHVRALHNDTRIAFLIEWNDRTHSRERDDRLPYYDSVALNLKQEESRADIKKRQVFNDVLAIQFPQRWQDYIPVQPIIDKKAFYKEIDGGPWSTKVRAAQFQLPNFFFGDDAKGVDIWKWESNSAVKLFSGYGADKMKVRRNEEADMVASEAKYRNGRWRVILSRSLRTKDSVQDIQFEQGRHIPIVFFAWDGDAGEVGNKMAFSSYYYLLLTPSKEGTPIQLRTYHPTPPKAISIQDKTHLIIGATSPLRAKEGNRHQELLLQNQREGATICFGKGACFLCHGANLSGKGLYRPALSPFPTNFMDMGTILQLEESVVFWRVAKGMRDLPSYAHPWSSTMPAHEEFLTVDEMWKVIWYLYARMEKNPKAWR